MTIYNYFILSIYKRLTLLFIYIIFPLLILFFFFKSSFSLYQHTSQNGMYPHKLKYTLAFELVKHFPFGWIARTRFRFSFSTFVRSFGLGVGFVFSYPLGRWPLCASHPRTQKEKIKQN